MRFPLVTFPTSAFPGLEQGMSPTKMILPVIVPRFKGSQSIASHTQKGLMLVTAWNHQIPMIMRPGFRSRILATILNFRLLQQMATSIKYDSSSYVYNTENGWTKDVQREISAPKIEEYLSNRAGNWGIGSYSVWKILFFEYFAQILKHTGRPQKRGTQWQNIS